MELEEAPPDTGIVVMQSFQGGDPSPEPWPRDSKKIGLGMKEKVIGFS